MGTEAISPYGLHPGAIPVEEDQSLFCLRRLETLCRDFHIVSLTPQLMACHESLQHRDLVEVAVVGRFKAGKSSFLNSLIGQDLMPVAVLPLTAVVTRLRYGPQNRAVLHLQDGTRQVVPLDSLAEYVTEPGKPGKICTAWPPSGPRQLAVAWTIWSARRKTSCRRNSIPW